jgi:hypothetical protein
MRKTITDALADDSKEIGREIKRTKYTFMYLHQNESQIIPGSGVKIFGNDSKKNQKHIREEMKNRLISGNACCYSVQSLLFYPLPFTNVKVWNVSHTKG